jgi:hypothetical protein
MNTTYMNPECEYFSCICESNEHALVVKLWDFSEPEGGDPLDVELSFDVFLCQHRSFWQRVWAAVRYVFGYRCRFGHFESATLKYEDADRLLELIHNYKRRVESLQPRVYHNLKIVAPTPETEIFVADSQGFFVQKEVGVMETRLLPGRYTYQFAVKGIARHDKVRFDLTGDLTFENHA